MPHPTLRNLGPLCTAWYYKPEGRSLYKNYSLLKYDAMLFGSYVPMVIVEAAGSSKCWHQTTWCHIPGDCNLDIHYCEYLKSQNTRIFHSPTVWDILGACHFRLIQTSPLEHRQTSTLHCIIIPHK
jgi:hypothetical protein